MARNFLGKGWRYPVMIDRNGGMAQSALDDLVPLELLRSPSDLAEYVLHRLLVRGQPIAALYNLVYRGRVYFYQCGRRVDIEGVRPGIVIHALALQRAIDQGLVEYDFLDGTSQYKRQISTHSNPLVTLRAVGPGTRAQAVDQVRQLGRHALAGAHVARARLLSASHR